MEQAVHLKKRKYMMKMMRIMMLQKRKGRSILNVPLLSCSCTFSVSKGNVDCTFFKIFIVTCFLRLLLHEAWLERERIAQEEFRLRAEREEAARKRKEEEEVILFMNTPEPVSLIMLNKKLIFSGFMSFCVCSG